MTDYVDVFASLRPDGFLVPVRLKHARPTVTIFLAGPRAGAVLGRIGT